MSLDLTKLAGSLPSSLLNEAQEAINTARLMKEAELCCEGFHSMGEALQFVNDMDPESEIFHSLGGPLNGYYPLHVIYWSRK